MKILKKGIKPTKTVKETCSKCNTLFEYEPSDIQMDFRDGNYVICPTCGGFISSGYQPVQIDRSKDC